MSKPTVVSLFAGCGGSSLGYRLAGFEERLAVEWDDNAVLTFKANFPGVPVYHGDVGKLSVPAALEMAGLKEGELDCLDGSPPCQGFSTSGRRFLEDERNSLFREYVRLLVGLRPKTLVMENVTGMVRGKMRLTFAEILRQLKAAGYEVSARILNAAHHGVPQARERVIFIGIRRDLGITPTHPKPMTRLVSAEEALRGLVNNESERQMLLEAGRTRSSFKFWSIVKPGQLLKDAIGKPAGFNCRKFHPNKPAYTVTKTDGILGLYGAMHWAEKRRFTVAEFKRFASFPDEFVFLGDYQDAVQRIGNCVPPLLMKAIAEHLRGLLAAGPTDARRPAPAAAVAAAGPEEF